MTPYDLAEQLRRFANRLYARGMYAEAQSWYERGIYHALNAVQHLAVYPVATRSHVYHTAARLARACSRFDLARDLAALGLAQYPDTDTRTELQQLIASTYRPASKILGRWRVKAEEMAEV